MAVYIEDLKALKAEKLEKKINKILDVLKECGNCEVVYEGNFHR